MANLTVADPEYLHEQFFELSTEFELALVHDSVLFLIFWGECTHSRPIMFSVLGRMNQHGGDTYEDISLT